MTDRPAFTGPDPQGYKTGDGAMPHDPEMLHADGSDDLLLAIAAEVHRQNTPVQVSVPPKGQREVHIIVTVKGDSEDEARGRTYARMGKPTRHNVWRFGDD